MVWCPVLCWGHLPLLVNPSSGTAAISPPASRLPLSPAAMCITRGHNDHHLFSTSMPGTSQILCRLILSNSSGTRLLSSRFYG